MRKFFYGIGVFAFLCILSLGYYSSYRIADMQKKMSLMEQVMEGEEAQAAELSKNTDTAEKDFDNEAEITSVQEGGYGLYYLKAENGCVMVYESDKKTLYEPTSILVSNLPTAMQKEIGEGKFLKTKEELYGFLENYSS